MPALRRVGRSGVRAVRYPAKPAPAITLRDRLTVSPPAMSLVPRTGLSASPRSGRPNPAAPVFPPTPRGRFPLRRRRPNRSRPPACPTRLVRMEILGATLRICVDDLEASVPFYERLAGGRAQRFERGGVSVAAVGCFLLMSGPEPELEILRKVAATIAVKDVDEAHRVLTDSGARVL